ncbi:MAG: hypothetical protein KBI10_08815 [Syntrophorhabdales bacterium]|jgi:hypothetical protein|nr:hypothetical protein [Syntrophorhabdales bacterium]
MDEKETLYMKWLDEFKSLTLDALDAIGSDDFINILLKRDLVIKNITEDNIKLDPEEIAFYIRLEEKILERLEEERKGVIQDIADMGDKKRVIRQYTPKFPFPPMPAFFDKKG